MEQFNDKNGGDSPPEYEKKETEMEKQSSMHRKQKKTIHIPYLKWITDQTERMRKEQKKINILNFKQDANESIMLK